jgi:hypothetical protein
MIRSSTPLLGLLTVMELMLAGCGGDGQFKVAATDGRVVCEGQAVPFVSVFFEPLPGEKTALTGKSAVGYADAEGNFVLTTYSKSDGAVIGKHRVRVAPPAGENGNGKFECPCVVSEREDVMEVQVEAGKNTFEVVLRKATAVDQHKAKKTPDYSDPEVDD